MYKDKNYNNICSQCCENFSDFIHENGEMRVCDFDASHGKQKVVDIIELAAHVDDYFQENYRLGEWYIAGFNEHDNPEREQYGEPYRDIMEGILCANSNVIDAVIANLPDCTGRDIQQGAKPFYNEWENYESLEDIKEREEQERLEYEEDQAYYKDLLNEDLLDEFNNRLNNLSKLLDNEHADEKIKELQYMMIFSFVVSSIEAYLSQNFQKRMLKETSNKNAILDYLGLSNMSKDKKNKLLSICLRNGIGDSRIKELIKEDMRCISFHNIKYVTGLYTNVFKMQFTPDIKQLIKNSEDYKKKRNHFVHRVGKDHRDNKIAVSESEIKQLINDAKSLCDFIEHYDISSIL